MKQRQLTTAQLNNATSALTKYDISQSYKKGYNKYALAQYFAALDSVATTYHSAPSLRDAVDSAFNDKLADIVFLALGGVE